jgi:hypothetical protein
LARLRKLLPLAEQVGELLIPLLWRGAFLRFDIGAQTIILLVEQTTDDGQAYAMPLGYKTRLQIAQTTIEPFAGIHRIAGRMRGDFLGQVCF